MTENKKGGGFSAFIEKVYGGLNMSWLNVILFAVATAVLTFIFLVFPIFKNTSFERMGVTMEAWVFFAVIIMANCKTPLDSAMKTFVFFLISQPLIYLLQVPFSEMGWKLFGYYPYWAKLTLLTFPAAYIGWYIKKKNWYSLLILLPVLFLLTFDYFGAFGTAIRHFPREIVTAFFCLGQVLVYLYRFTPLWSQRAIGLIVPLASLLVMRTIRPAVNFSGTNFLPEVITVSESAEIVVDENDFVTVTFAEKGEDPLILIHATDYGTAAFTIVDGDQEYRYEIEIYEDSGRHLQTRITPLN